MFTDTDGTRFGTQFQVRKMRKSLSMAAVGVLALSLAACGGGGSTLGGSSTGGTTGGTGGTTTTTYSMGNGNGSSFQAGMIGLSSTSLSAGGAASLTVTIVDQNGTLYTGASTTVSFNSPCVAQGLAKIAASGASTAGPNAGTVVTTTGSVSATYTATGCSGADVITATATVGTTALTASGTITVAAAAIGSIQFKSASPATIGLKGTGLGETSTVIFKVVDSSGGPRPGVTVNFALSTTTGGISLAPASATSGSDGTVQTVVSSGTAHTSVVVTASITSPALSTQSGVLAVTTGLPRSSAFSLGVACQNVEAYNVNGVVVPVTAILSDRYQNPAPDGTAVAFNTNGGQIVGNCSTTGGTCSVNWVSADPRPQPTDSPPSKRAGRVTILATAIGEESFNDVNSNGFYDAGEPFDDLGEPYRDDNENGKYDLGEKFLDFNQNQLRDPPSGTYKGITCTGNTPGSTCSTTTLAIGKMAMIVMSESSPFGIVPAPNTPLGPLAKGATVSYTFLIQDSHLNPLPAGTTVTLAAVGAGITVNAPASFIIGCTTDPTPFSFSVSASATATSGSLTLTTKTNGVANSGTAGGVATTVTYPLTIP
jgi:hypothetical protein